MSESFLEQLELNTYAMSARELTIDENAFFELCSIINSIIEDTKNQKNIDRRLVAALYSIHSVADYAALTLRDSKSPEADVAMNYAIEIDRLLIEWFNQCPASGKPVPGKRLNG